MGPGALRSRSPIRMTRSATCSRILGARGEPLGSIAIPRAAPGWSGPHAATVVGTYQLSYDNNGNQMGITGPVGAPYGFSGTFNVDNRLASAVTTFGSTTVNSTFVYDGEGSCVKKTVQDTTGTSVTRYISKLYECDTFGTRTSCSRFIRANDTRIATVSCASGLHWPGSLPSYSHGGPHRRLSILSSSHVKNFLSRCTAQSAV
jgi:hypothetical protein